LDEDESRFRPDEDFIDRFVEDAVDEDAVARSFCEAKTEKCARRKTGYSNAVLLQAFDWQSWMRGGERRRRFTRAPRRGSG
tara:strand:+ start:3669 stop:3911 length:243 start_codon:yes stop_codon:yes gene_type:complete